MVHPLPACHRATGSPTTITYYFPAVIQLLAGKMYSVTDIRPLRKLITEQVSQDTWPER